VHALARHGGAFAALGAQGLSGPAEALVQHIDKALHAGVARFAHVELLGAGEKDVAVSKVKGARVAVMRIVSGEIADGFGLEVILHRVAEGLGEEENAFAVMREVRPLSEVRQLRDVRRQVPGWIYRRICRGISPCGGKRREDDRDDGRKGSKHDAILPPPALLGARLQFRKMLHLREPISDRPDTELGRWLVRQRFGGNDG
jgi:hypothetical protein